MTEWADGIGGTEVLLSSKENASSVPKSQITFIFECIAHSFVTIL